MALCARKPPGPLFLCGSKKKFEGPRNKRIKLDERKMDFDKLWRKTAKQVSWVPVALLTSMTFVGYFTDIRELFINFFTLDAGFWATFSVLFFLLYLRKRRLYARNYVRTCARTRASSPPCSIKTRTQSLTMPNAVNRADLVREKRTRPKKG